MCQNNIVLTSGLKVSCSVITFITQMFLLKIFTKCSSSFNISKSIIQIQNKEEKEMYVHTEERDVFIQCLIAMKIPYLSCKLSGV